MIFLMPHVLSVEVIFKLFNKNIKDNITLIINYAY